MAVSIKILKPKVGTLRIHHPFLTTKTGNMIKKSYKNLSSGFNLLYFIC